MKDIKLVCRYCAKWHSTPEKARECENGHDVVFVPLLREDLNRLVNFIATGERALLTERLSKALFKSYRTVVDD